jgi:predicted secreted hydrolase
MSRRRAIAAAVLALALAVAGLALWPGGDGAVSRARWPRASIAVRDALGSGDPAGFARADAPRPFVFPDDHGPHAEFRTEWWYYTGNLATATGRHVGFELTFFRTALAPAEPAAAPRASAWSTRQLYLAHFAVTDTASARFHAASRLGRAAVGLAGAEARPFRVWLEDWSVVGADADTFPVRLRAADGEVAIDLALDAGKPIVLQGDRGLSRKGPEPGNASYYYSLTRMPARGTVRVGGETLAVSGRAWMDREWSTSALGPDLGGWDWFALQLDDGRDVMVYRLRRKDGSPDPHSAGAIVAPDGAARALSVADTAIEVLDRWTSAASGVAYPSRWRVTIPSAELSLEIIPRIAAQELDVGTRYWEGAVRLEGRAGGRPVSGQGYVELVGYGE